MRLLPLLCCVLLASCNLNSLPMAPSPIPAFVPTPTSVDTASWRTLAPGLETRTYLSDNSFEFQAVRIDPQHYSFRAHYVPGEARRLEQWREMLPDPIIIVNANFFTHENTVLGLLVSDGVVYGRSYRDRGGTFFVQDGIVGIRSNIDQPYRGEALQQAVQAFPMLVVNGAAAYSDSRDIRPARRTLIGQDSAGRIIVMVTPGFGPGLYALSQYLPTTDIGLVSAFNLDGGGSTMLYIAPENYTVRSFDPVPAVLAAYPKN